MGEYSSECPRGGGSIISFFGQIQKNKDFWAVIITLLIFFFDFFGDFIAFSPIFWLIYCIFWVISGGKNDFS